MPGQEKIQVVAYLDYLGTWSLCIGEKHARARTDNESKVLNLLLIGLVLFERPWRSCNGPGRWDHIVTTNGLVASIPRDGSHMLCLVISSSRNQVGSSSWGSKVLSFSLYYQDSRPRSRTQWSACTMYVKFQKSTLRHVFCESDLESSRFSTRYDALNLSKAWDSLFNCSPIFILLGRSNGVLQYTFS